MSRGWQLALWPLVLGAYVVAMVVVLALVHPFEPEAPAAAAGEAAGDVYRGETVYLQSCAGATAPPARAGSASRWPAPASTRRARRPRFGPAGA